MIELEQAGANLLATDQQGNTCLHLAARFGHKDIVKFLIEAAPPAILDMGDHEKWDFLIILISVLKYVADMYCYSCELLWTKYGHLKYFIRMDTTKFFCIGGCCFLS